MQDLIIYNENQVIIQCDNKIYQDTKDNFLLDYGKKVDYEAINYNRATRQCWLNGEAFQKYPNELCEDILNSIDTLLSKKAEREHVGSFEPSAEDEKAAEIAAIDSRYAADKAALLNYYVEALATGNTELAAEISTEIKELNATYDTEMEAIKND